jgi:hypothetical protein
MNQWFAVACTFDNKGDKRCRWGREENQKLYARTFPY